MRSRAAGQHDEPTLKVRNEGELYLCFSHLCLLERRQYAGEAEDEEASRLKCLS